MLTRFDSGKALHGTLRGRVCFGREGYRIEFDSARGPSESRGSAGRSGTFLAPRDRYAAHE
jgi:hypothetical protein